VHDLPAGERVKKLVPGLKPKREACGEPTDSWPCPCRSRFHVGQEVRRSA